MVMASSSQLAMARSPFPFPLKLGSDHWCAAAMALRAKRKRGTYAPKAEIPAMPPPSFLCMNCPQGSSISLDLRQGTPWPAPACSSYGDDCLNREPTFMAQQPSVGPFVDYLKTLQDSIVSALEAADGEATFLREEIATDG